MEIRVKGRTKFDVVIDLEKINNWEEIEFRNMDRSESDKMIKNELAKQGIYPYSFVVDKVREGI